MKRFVTVLLSIVLLYTAGFSYLELSARAESETWVPLSDPVTETLPEAAALPVEPSAVPTAETSSEPTPEPTPTPTPEPTPEPTPTPTPEPTSEPTPTPTPEPEPLETSGYQPGYYIKVNVSANTVTVYTSDDNGEFNQPYRAMVCSTGEATPTSGVYQLGWRLQWQNLFGGVYGQYVCQIVGNILFHSVPYVTKYDKGSLEYWEFDKLGTSCSMGCVRLQVKDAKWIYDHFSSVVGVEFYTSDDPGPLGKPSAPTISGNERCRGWDPTDPDAANPWLRPEESPEPSQASTSTEAEIVIVTEPAPTPTAPPAAESVPERVSEPEPEIASSDDEILVD